MHSTVQTIPSQRPRVRPVPPPNLPATAATFNSVYMRPNISNGGLVPAAGPYCTCPDIWPAGITPIPNFQTALATSQSYGTNPPDQITLYFDNYIYVRGCNGATANKTETVALYYVPSGVIQWPSQWQNNVIPTDQGNKTANITNLTPGSVGVADQTFLWSNVQPPPEGSDHYCLISQFNDANNSNPFPSIYTQLDMSGLVTNNLGWGWRNVQLVSANAQPTFTYDVSLTIPQNVAPGSNTYFIFVTPTGFNGFSVSFQCSQTDSRGNPISLVETLITSSGQLLGQQCYLEPGFNAVVSVSLFSNGVTARAGASVPLSASYQTASGFETEEAVRRNLIDWKFMYRYRKNIGIGPTPWIPLGDYSAQNGVSLSAFRSRRNHESKGKRTDKS